MSDETPWISAPLGGAATPRTHDTREVDDVDDDEFHARLGGVPIERLSANPGESRIDQLPPPPYAPEPPVAAAGTPEGAFSDPWARRSTGDGSWDLGDDEPQPIHTSQLHAPEPSTANTGPAESVAASTNVETGSVGDVWADGADATRWDPRDTPAAETASGELDDLFDTLGTPAAEPHPFETGGTPAGDAVSGDPWDAFVGSGTPAETAAAAAPPAGPAASYDEAPEAVAPPAPRVDLDADGAAAPDPDVAVSAATPAPDAADLEREATPEPHAVAPRGAETPPAAGATDAPSSAAGIDRDDLELDDLFGDDDEGDDGDPPAAAPSPAAGRPAARKWALGVDRYEDPQIVYAAERITAQASSIPEITNVTREFQLTRDPHLDAEQRRAFETALEPHLQFMELPISPGDFEAVLSLTYDELLGLGPLGAAWRSDEVTEILVDGWDRVVVEVGGELLATDMRFRDADQAASIARDLAQKVSDRQLSPSTPLVTAKLDRARVNFAYGPVVPELGLAISIRKFNAQLSMAGLLEVGALTAEMRDLLWAIVQTRGTVLVSGATGVGKTTLLSAAAEAIPYNERIITIEDAREISLGDRLSWVPMQTKEKASGDDKSLIEQSDLLVNSLRQRPDRLIVGEVRDGRTASVMLEAANTGHEGTMTTLHANSASDALNSRIVRAIRRHENSPAEVIREEVAEAFDLVLHGIRRNGRRYVAEICEVSPRYLRDGRIEPRVLWRGQIDSSGNVTFEHVAGIDPEGRNAERLAEAGIDPTAFDPQ